MQRALGLPRQAWQLQLTFQHRHKLGPCYIFKRPMVVAKASAAGATWQQPRDAYSIDGAYNTLAESLSWRPSLSLAQEAGCIVASSFVCTLLYLVSAPAKFNIQYAAVIAVVHATLVWFLRCTLLEQQYAAHARLYHELGDPDSSFPKVSGIQVHAKTSVSQELRQLLARHHDSETADALNSEAASQQTPLAVTGVHCYHGFGANLYSYSPVQSRMARALNGIVTSHDMPGFGLTERPTSTSHYFLAFNGQLGDEVLCHQVKHYLDQSSASPTGPLNAPTAKQTSNAVHAERVVSHPLSRVNSFSSFVDQEEDETMSVDMVHKPGVSGRSSLDGSARSGSPVSVLHGLNSEDSASSMTSSTVSCASSTVGDVTPLRQDSLAGAAAMENQQVEANAQGPRLLLRKVLMGHSLGGICASLQALKQPESIAALVLVAPAVIALPDKSTPLYEMKQFEGSTIGNAGNAKPAAPPCENLQCPVVDRAPDTGSAAKSDSGNAAATPAGATSTNPFKKAKRIFKALLQAVIFGWTLAVLNILRPIIIAVLRTLVRSKGFWQKGLQQAYYDPNRVTDQLVDAYRMPQLVSGWEAGMFNFLTARLAHTTDWKQLVSQFNNAAADTSRGSSKPGSSGATAEQGAVAAATAAVEQQAAAEDLGLAHRLALFSERHQVPVLIIHGVYDKLVPASNSRRLAAMLPGCELVLMDKTGHMPQEEWPQKFVEVVKDFIDRRVIEPGLNRGQIMNA